jgi:hypothetical protein
MQMSLKKYRINVCSRTLYKIALENCVYRGIQEGVSEYSMRKMKPQQFNAKVCDFQLF